MKVLLFNGSPHKEGCVYTALQEVAGALEKEGVESEILWIGTKPVSGCLACRRCYEKGHCVLEDGVAELSARLDEFDGFIFGSPVYYGSASGQICSFMDRLFYSSSAKLRGKPAAAVVSCRRGGATAAFDRLNKYFTISQMPVVSSQYWNQVHGNSPEEVRQDEEGLQIMRTLGKNMAWLLKSIHRAALPLPEREKPAHTNFIR
ncbi:MAG: flavodoxin family protein [Oscillospiraceae bacterium]|nr:flavodoxin family protein [Oscillospiraceae bacterium]